MNMPETFWTFEASDARHRWRKRFPSAHMELAIFGKLIRASARLQQTGCDGCIGITQVPATGHISLRSVPRN